MSRYAAGTPLPGSSYTQEQYAMLEATIKQPGLQLGAAKAQYVNKTLCPDGTVVDDLDALREAAAESEEHAEHLEAHIDERRFLFVVNEEGVPVVFFQCAVPGNPDVPEMVNLPRGEG